MKRDHCGSFNTCRAAEPGDLEGKAVKKGGKTDRVTAEEMNGATGRATGEENGATSQGTAEKENGATGGRTSGENGATGPGTAEEENGTTGRGTAEEESGTNGERGTEEGVRNEEARTREEGEGSTEGGMKTKGKEVWVLRGPWVQVQIPLKVIQFPGENVVGSTVRSVGTIE